MDFCTALDNTTIPQAVPTAEYASAVDGYSVESTGNERPGTATIIVLSSGLTLQYHRYRRIIP